MPIETIAKNRLLIVRFDKIRLDPHAAICFRKTVSSLLHNDIEKMVINLTKTEFINSSGLSTIIALL